MEPPASAEAPGLAASFRRLQQVYRDTGTFAVRRGARSRTCHRSARRRFRRWRPLNAPIPLSLALSTPLFPFSPPLPALSRAGRTTRTT